MNNFIVYSDNGYYLGTYETEAEARSAAEAYTQAGHHGVQMYTRALPKPPEAPEDLINSPSHYRNHPSGVECIQIVRHFPYNLGVAMAYIWRNGKKAGNAAAQDLKKAVWHLQDEIATLEGKMDSNLEKPQEKPQEKS